MEKEKEKLLVTCREGRAVLTRLEGSKDTGHDDDGSGGSSQGREGSSGTSGDRGRTGRGQVGSVGGNRAEERVGAVSDGGRHARRSGARVVDGSLWR